jgi:hypothetical protein
MAFLTGLRHTFRYEVRLVGVGDFNRMISTSSERDDIGWRYNAATGWLTGAALVLCFNFIARRTGGIEASVLTNEQIRVKPVWPLLLRNRHYLIDLTLAKGCRFPPVFQ